MPLSSSLDLGYFDGLVDESLVGWASFGPDDPSSPVVELLIDGLLADVAEASIYRPGVLKRGLHPTGRCGFRFPLELFRDGRCSPRVVSVRVRCREGGTLELRNSPCALVFETAVTVPSVMKCSLLLLPGTGAGDVLPAFDRVFRAEAIAFEHHDSKTVDVQDFTAFDFVASPWNHEFSGFVRAALFRRPRPLVFARINTLRRFAQGIQSQEWSLNSDWLPLANALADIQPGDEARLRDALESDPSMVRKAFDNLQTRGLLNGFSGELTAEHMSRAMTQLQCFDVIGVRERLDIFIEAVGKACHAPNLTVPSEQANQQLADLYFEDFSADSILPFIERDREIYWAASANVRHHGGLKFSRPNRLKARSPKPVGKDQARLLSVTAATAPDRQPFSVVNAAKDAPDRTLVVLGVSRGGTSLVAGLLKLCGVFMGAKLSSGSHEDIEFHESDPERLRELIARRNSEHRVWGWKYPHTLDYVRDIEDQLRNPHFLVIYRDVLSVSQAFCRHESMEIKHALKDAQSRYAALTRFATESQAPILAISYEKAIANPNALIRGVSQFCGLNPSVDQKAQCVDFIRPGRYVSI